MSETPDFMRAPGDSLPYGGASERILSVSSLNRSARDLLEHRMPLIWVAGEISNLSVPRSGHYYFSLKDESAQVRCVMFRSRAALLDWQPREGMHVEVRALVTLYEARGDFQLNLEFMRRAGQGALHEAFLRLRDRLAREGLFDAQLKRPLPAYPRAIGVVTSLQAAALRDVLTTLGRRNASIPIIVYPTMVQGQDAPAQIVAALQAAGRRAEVDVLILCRGGGSLEDLNAFNDEAVARAIRACPMPVVCGVGHETDFSIADFAADQRAPTPTAAAELLSVPRVQVLARIAEQVRALGRCATRAIEVRIQHIDHLSRRLQHPAQRLQAQRVQLAQFEHRLARLIHLHLDAQRGQLVGLLGRRAAIPPPIDALRAKADGHLRALCIASQSHNSRRAERLNASMRALEHLDPRAVLQRGYSIVRDRQGSIVRDAHSLSIGDPLDIRFAQGNARARIETSDPD